MNTSTQYADQPYSRAVAREPWHKVLMLIKAKMGA